MKQIASLALQAFEKLPLEKQHALLLQYVEYVEETILADEVPLFFLEWFLLQPTEHVPFSVDNMTTGGAND